MNGKILEELSINKSNSTVPEIQHPDPSVIDDFVSLINRFRHAESKIKEEEAKIKTYGESILLERSLINNFTKSIILKGKRHSIIVRKSDRFSIKGENAEQRIKKILKKKFNDFFEKEKIVSVKDEIFLNDKILNEFLKKFTKEEFEKYFDVSFNLRTKKGFDEKQFDLDPEEREELKEVVVQAQPSLIVHD